VPIDVKQIGILFGGYFTIFAYGDVFVLFGGLELRLYSPLVKLPKSNQLPKPISAQIGYTPCYQLAFSCLSLLMKVLFPLTNLNLFIALIKAHSFESFG